MEYNYNYRVGVITLNHGWTDIYFQLNGENAAVKNNDYRVFWDNFNELPINVNTVEKFASHMRVYSDVQGEIGYKIERNT